MDKQRRSYSNRIRTAPKEQLDAQRREFLNLANAEPNLGFPGPIGDPVSQPSPELDHVLVSREDGTKGWSQRPVGLKIDGDLSQIINKHRFDEGFVPTLENLRFGEILINAYDAKLFIRTLIDGNEGIAEIETGVQGIQGPQGTQGVQGERMPFIPIDVVGSVPNVNGTYPGGGPNNPQGALGFYFPSATIGSAVFDETTSNVWVQVGTTWINVGLLRGPQGIQGVIGPQGIQGRVGSQGFVGPQGIRGPIGSQGTQGTQGLQGIQGNIGRSLRLLGTVDEVTDIPLYPSAAPGTEVGDAYIVLNGGNIYIWNGTTWFNGGRIIIQGTQGTQGTQGVQGLQGLRGFSLKLIGTYNDPDVPITAEYLQLTYPDAEPFSAVVDISSGNGELWQTFGDGAWTKIGPVSVQGVQGLQGIQGAQGTQGIQGAQGTQGIQGQVGKPLRIIGTYNDPSEPISSEILNDLFPQAEAFDSVVDNSLGNSFLWVKNELGICEEIGLIGVQGTQGVQGTLGIQGIQGFEGPQGIQGFEGLQGVQGNLGIQGIQGLQGLQGPKAAYIYSETPPPSPEVGDIWFYSSTGIKFQWIFDGDGFQWVEIIAMLQGPQGLQGSLGSSGPQGTQGIFGTNAVYSDATPQPLGTASPGTVSSASRADHVHVLPTLSTLGLGTTSTPQFGGLGLGVALASGWDLQANGGVLQNRSTITISGSTYTLDVQSANEFVTGAAIAGATTINLSNIASIPNGYVWRGVLSFSYTGGTVSWFTGNTGYTVKWDGGTAPTLTASDLETVVITVVGGGTTIEVTAQQGRA